MDMVKALAGSRAQSLVPPALECSICQELMIHPYALGCGHTFCGSCLKHWFTNRQQSETEKTCPTCRDGVRVSPVLVHAIRELTNNVLDAIKAMDPAKADELRRNAAPDPGREPFENLYFLNPMNDRDDGVLRCQYCAWEVRDGYCEGCGRPQAGSAAGSTSESDDVSDILSGDDADELSEGADSFINDGEIEYEESDPDALSNVRRRVIEISDDEESSPESDSDIVSRGPTLDVANNNRVITILSSDEEFEGAFSDEFEVNEDDMQDDEVENSDIGRENMPIILSDSSDVMSSFEESD